MGDPVLNIVTEMSDQPLNGPGGGIPKGANCMAFHLFGDIEQHINFVRFRITGHQPLHHTHHPACAFTARRALSAAFMLVKLGQSPNSFDHIRRLIHHNDRRSAQA